MSEKVGLDCVLARNTGTYGTPVWTTIPEINDLTLALTKDAAESKKRATRFKKFLPTLKEVPLEAKLQANPGTNTNYDALQDAWMNDTILDLAVADGAIATVGTRYLRGDFFVSDFKRNEPLTDLVNVDLAFKLDARSANPDPAFFTTAS